MVDYIGITRNTAEFCSDNLITVIMVIFHVICIGMRQTIGKEGFFSCLLYKHSSTTIHFSTYISETRDILRVSNDFTRIKTSVTAHSLTTSQDILFQLACNAVHFKKSYFSDSLGEIVVTVAAAPSIVVARVSVGLRAVPEREACHPMLV